MHQFYALSDRVSNGQRICTQKHSEFIVIIDSTEYTETGIFREHESVHTNHPIHCQRERECIHSIPMDIPMQYRTTI